MKVLKIIIGIITSIGFINMLFKLFNHIKNAQNEEIPIDIVALAIGGAISFYLFYSAFRSKPKNE
jgi:hypothetical protein